MKYANRYTSQKSGLKMEIDGPVYALYPPSLHDKLRRSRAEGW